MKQIDEWPMATDADTLVVARAAERAAPEPGGALALVRALCEALEAEDLNYCHWKSNEAIDRSASGENDLDLLIDRADVAQFTAILGRLGFKYAAGRAHQQMPGVSDYYGYDREADRVVHVHAHYQLVLGDDMTKNYRLPLEQPYLASARRAGLFRLPAPEFEYVVLVIRMVLKHCVPDAALSLRGSVPRSAQRELAFLQARVSDAEVAALLRQHLPFVAPELFARCLAAVSPGRSTLGARLAAGRSLQRALRAYARRPPLADTTLKFWRLARLVLRSRVLRLATRKRLGAGGAIIALVGGDGAGKSTAVGAAQAWLAKYFETRTIHLGKPPQSWATRSIRAASLASRWLGARLGRNWSVSAGLAADAPAFLRYLWLLRRVSVARDRYRTYRKARSFATNGGLVISDRFPLEQLRSMDGRQGYRLGALAPGNRQIARLIAAEERYYQQIMPPELLIVLRADPELAVQRRREQAADMVRARNQEIWDADWSQSRAQIVDANRPQAEVLARIKQLIWSRI